VHVSAAELNHTKGIKFSVIAVSGITVGADGNPDFSQIHGDAAPDAGHGVFTYPVLTKLVLTATAFSTSPKPARAGKPFSVALAANENDTNGPVAGATVACAATIGT